MVHQFSDLRGMKIVWINKCFCSEINKSRNEFCQIVPECVLILCESRKKTIFSKMYYVCFCIDILRLNTKQEFKPYICKMQDY